MNSNLYRNTLKERGLKNLTVAKDTKINPARLSLILNGWVEAKAFEAEAISKALKVDRSQLFPAEKFQKKRGSC